MLLFLAHRDIVYRPGTNSSSRSLTMLSTNVVWQPVCEKRVDILSTHSKTVHLDSFLPLMA